jgi:hypothetical protein
MSDIVIDFTADRYSESPAAREAERQSHKRKNTSSHKRRNESRANNSLDQTSDTTQAGASAGSVPYRTNMAQPAPPATGSIEAQMSDSHIQSSGKQLGAAPTLPGYNMPQLGTVNHAGQDMMSMSGTGFSPAYGYTAGPTDNSASFDPMFGTLPTNAFGSPAGWQGEDTQQHNKVNMPTSGVAPSPGNKSTSGSTGTGHSEEKDPFLSLLEQLAEDEQRFNSGGIDLDFFLSGNNNGG